MQNSTKIIFIVAGLALAVSLAVGGAATICSSQAVVIPSDGVSGIGSDVWWGAKMMGYCLLAVAAAVAVVLLTLAVKMGAGVFGGLGSWIKSLVLDVVTSLRPAPPILDTVLASNAGKTFTIKDLVTHVRELKIEVAAIAERTAHIEPPPPPPPPKSAEQVIAEQAAMMTELQRQIQAMQAAKPVAAVAAVAVAPKPVVVAQAITQGAAQ